MGCRERGQQEALGSYNLHSVGWEEAGEWERGSGRPQETWGVGCVGWDMQWVVGKGI